MSETGTLCEHAKERKRLPFAGVKREAIRSRDGSLKPGATAPLGGKTRGARGWPLAGVLLLPLVGFGAVLNGQASKAIALGPDGPDILSVTTC